MEKLDILVFGAGAIGTYIGGSLAQAGHHVTFIEQPQAVDELQQRGLQLELPNPNRRAKKTRSSSFIIPPSSFTCVSSLEKALQVEPFDVAVFALKSFDTQTVLDGIRPFAKIMPPVLCLQNGVENEPAIAAILGAGKVIAGTVTSSVGRRGVGDIVLERSRGVGLASTHPLSNRLSAALTEAGLKVQTFLHPADMKWSKMLTNLPANAVAAILDLTAAEVFTHPGLFRLEMEILREALQVMRAHGIKVVNLPGTPVRALAWGIYLPEWIARPLMQKAVGGGRGGKMPSFHIDLHSGRGKSEVEWLNGAVVRFGEQAGISTPVNRFLTETLMALIRGEVPLDEYTRRPEKLLAML
jgi:2-dehydropantoate 2-reductase